MINRDSAEWQDYQWECGVIDALNGKRKKSSNYSYIEGWKDAFYDPWFYMP